MKIKINAIPPGQAPEHIRSAWIGIEIPEAKPDTPQDGERPWDGDANVGGYIVTGQNAFSALKEAGKDEAYRFWTELPHIEALRFSAEVCEPV